MFYTSKVQKKNQSDGMGGGFLPDGMQFLSWVLNGQQLCLDTGECCAASGWLLWKKIRKKHLRQLSKTAVDTLVLQSDIIQYWCNAF